MKNWAVSLTFRCFKHSKEMIKKILGEGSYEIGMRGFPVKEKVQTLLKKSYVRSSIEFQTPPNIFEVIPAIIVHVGGVERIQSLKEQLLPEFFEVNIVMPIKSSLEQEGGFISIESIKDLYSMDALLSFEFLESICVG